jgi:acyl-CoA synthetase (AMP-forming)/AMP-acid ligase II
MVPSMAHQLATSPKLVRLDLSSLTSMNSGAAYLPPELRQRLSARAKNVVHFGEGYGMSECVCTNPYPPIDMLT